MVFSHYLELIFITKVVKRGTGEDTRYLPDIPDLQYGMVLNFVGGVNYYAYPLPESTLGKDCLSHVRYRITDSAIVEKAPGIVGRDIEVTKLEAYKAIVKTTVAEKYIADTKATLIAEAEAKGEIVAKEVLDAVKYDVKDHPDANDGVPVWIFNTKEYIDK